MHCERNLCEEGERRVHLPLGPSARMSAPGRSLEAHAVLGAGAGFDMVRVPRTVIYRHVLVK